MYCEHDGTERHRVLWLDGRFWKLRTFDAVLHDGLRLHNTKDFRTWAKVNRDTVGDNNDIVFFIGASLKSPGLLDFLGRRSTRFVGRS